MSALQPVVYTSYSNYAVEEAERPYELPPVEPVEAAPPASAAESAETGYPGENAEPDAVTLSNAAMNAMRNPDERARSAQRQTTAAGDVPAVAADLRNNLGIRDLLLSFAEYDNRAAAARYDSYLNMFANYGGASSVSGESDIVAGIRSQENDVYQNFGLSFSDQKTREGRERVSGAIDEWLAGTGVFSPFMLGSPSSDGFRFTPLTSASRASLRAADVLASYERTRVATYLREMSALTPRDFMFYDPTGLGALPLRQRREFLSRMDLLLQQARSDARAAELHYVFNAENAMDLDRLGLENNEEIARLERFRDEINTYYGQLLGSVRHYDAGIVSDAME